MFGLSKNYELMVVLLETQWQSFVPEDVVTIYLEVKKN